MLLTEIKTLNYKLILTEKEISLLKNMIWVCDDSTVSHETAVFASKLLDILPLDILPPPPKTTITP